MSSKRIQAIIYRHLVLWSRDLEKITDTFWWPVLDLIVWGFITIYLQRQGGAVSYVIMAFLGGIMFWSIINRVQLDIGVSFLNEAWDRNLLNIFASPITIWEFLTAMIILGLIKLTFSLGIVIILALLLYKFNIFIMSWYLIPFIFNLLIMGWWIGIFTNSLIIRFGYRAQNLAWTLAFIFQPVSGVYYPISALPSFLQIIAKMLPSSYIFEGMRSVLKTGSYSNQLLVMSTILNVIYLVLALLFYQSMFKASQKNGYLTHFS